MFFCQRFSLQRTNKKKMIITKRFQNFNWYFSGRQNRRSCVSHYICKARIFIIICFCCLFFGQFRVECIRSSIWQGGLAGRWSSRSFSWFLSAFGNVKDTNFLGWKSKTSNLPLVLLRLDVTYGWLNPASL